VYGKSPRDKSLNVKTKSFRAGQIIGQLAVQVAEDVKRLDVKTKDGKLPTCQVAIMASFGMVAVNPLTQPVSNARYDVVILVKGLPVASIIAYAIIG
jgi:hypothetical protein